MAASTRPTIRASADGLRRIAVIKKKKGWTNQELVDRWTNKELVNNGKRYFSRSALDRFLAGKTPISQPIFVAICQAFGIDDWEAIADLSSDTLQAQLPSFSNYNQQTWAGRDALVSNLLLKLQGQIRLLWLTGMSGIGKTALGECLASQAWESNPSFQWVYLEILEGPSKDFASVAEKWLAKLGEHKLSPADLNNPEQLATLLLQKLQSQPYWIQMDALERLLNPEQPAEFVDGYWITFFQRCLTESHFVSRLVLTAQSLPAALVEFGDNYSNTWLDVRLDGLSEVDQRLDFFAKRGVVVEEANREILTRIAAIYEGHPLVLKVIAEDILKKYAGDAFLYWQGNQREFEQVSRELQNAQLDETEYNDALNRRVRERIRKSLEQLPADALKLLCCSAVFRRPVPKKFWLAMISSGSLQDGKAKLTPRQQNAIYWVLLDWALIEEEAPNIRQHNLIRTIAFDLLKTDISTWEKAERKAADQWLTAYQPAPDAPNLEKVRGYLEAFYHFCEVKDDEAAWEVIETRLDTPTKHFLTSQLFVWGYFQEQIHVYESFLEVVRPTKNSHKEGIVMNMLGIAFTQFGKHTQAIKCHQKALNIFHKVRNHQIKVTTLVNLGLAYKMQGNIIQALKIDQQALHIVSRIDNRHKEREVLTRIGSDYFDIGDYQRSLNFHQQALTISSEIGNHQDEDEDRMNCQKALAKLGNTALAIEHFQKALNIARKKGDKQGEVISLEALGVIFTDINLQNYDQAFEYYRQVLVIVHDSGERWKEANTLNQMGTVSSGLGHHTQALDYHQQALSIAREIKSRPLEGMTLSNLGIVYAFLKNEMQMMKFFLESLEIFRELGNKLQEGAVWVSLGNAHDRSGDYQRSVKFHETSLEIFREISDHKQEKEALANLGNAYYGLEEYKQAISYHKQYLTLAHQVGNRQEKATALWYLGNAYQKNGEYKKAIRYHWQQLKIAHDINQLAVVIALNNLEIDYRDLKNYQKAIEYFEQYLVMAREIVDAQEAVSLKTDMRALLTKLAHYAEEFKDLQLALAKYRGIGDRANESETLHRLAKLHQQLANQQLGQVPYAIEYCQQALALAAEVGIPLAEKCRKLKEELEKQGGGNRPDLGRH
jgi:tetratricopeptide (TPR) repeat protein